jgi:hypothetical protein
VVDYLLDDFTFDAEVKEKCKHCGGSGYHPYPPEWVYHPDQCPPCPACIGEQQADFDSSGNYRGMETVYYDPVPNPPKEESSG